MEYVIDWVAGAEAHVGHRTVLNFASSNYLGIDSLGWLRSKKQRLQRKKDSTPEVMTLGMPRGLAISSAAREFESAIEETVQAPSLAVRSTLHGLIDLLQVLLPRSGLLVISEHAYRITRIAAEHARGRGINIATIRDWTGTELKEVLRSRHCRDAVIICETLRVPGSLAPLPDLAAVAAAHDATLVVDDTQAFGLLGNGACGLDRPYGIGGAGALSYTACPTERVVQVASLAKALGVPIAFVAGPPNIIESLRTSGPLIWAGSPPDVLTCLSGTYALLVHRACGEELRRRLAANVTEFERLTGIGGCGLFPIRTWYAATARQGLKIEKALFAQGVWAIADAAPSERRHKVAIRFLLTANHDSPILARAAHAIVRARSRVCR